MSMASETYFAIGARVRFHSEWHDDLLMRMYGLTPEDVARINALVGTVVEVDYSPRECAYYTIAWDTVFDGPAYQSLALRGDVEEYDDDHVTTCEQSDALVAV